MSAALALQAHRWRCLFSYVGGTQRTKDNVGIVVSGKEQVLHTRNPWDVLGYQAVEDATILFDKGAFAAASQLLEPVIQNTREPARKRELQALKTLADAYEAWDRFQHGDALNRLRELAKYDNDLGTILADRWARRLRTEIDDHRNYLEQLVNVSGPTWERVKDLLANAVRRGRQRRFDDAVARLYRALEAMAQVRLREAHGIEDTKRIPLERVPEELA